jgi:tetratricopeptide (TPR) repeat protein
MCVYAANNSNSAVKLAIQKYKAANYIGCVQDTEEIIKKDPTNAYAYYYQALAYSQLGKKEQATEAYEKVITLKTSAFLVENAQKGLNCLNGQDGCKPKEDQNSDLDEFIKSNKFYGNKVQEDLNKNRVKDIKDTMNKSEIPTNDEIAEAVKTLARAGINLTAVNNMNPAAMSANSAEMMQMNMLMGNDSMNNNNMLPYMLTGTNGNISPEMIQAVMMSNMASGFAFNGQTY